MKVTNVFWKTLKALRNKKELIISYGGSRCFYPGQKIVLKDSVKNISDVSIGDTVLTYNEDTKEKEYKKVKDVFKYKNTKKTLKITLKNGSVIKATEDHKVYFNGGWYSLKYIVSLLNGKMENNT